MDTKQIVKDIFKQATKGDLPGKGKYEGTSYSISDRQVTYGKKIYEIMGEKRLSVKELLKPKVQKAPSADSTFEAKCRSCGKAFQLSKFNPYHDICPECRAIARKAKRFIGESETIVCRKCGATIEASVYDFNKAKLCDTCKPKKAKKAEKKSA